MPLENINFSLEEGEFIGIVGKSGSGKSTVLKSIYRTYLPEKGAILYSSEKFGMVDLVAAYRKEKSYICESMKLVMCRSF